MKIYSVRSDLDSNNITIEFEDGSRASIDKAHPFGDPESHWEVRLWDHRPEYRAYNQFARIKDRDVAAGFASKFVCALLSGKPVGFWIDGWDYLRGDDVKGYDSKKLLKKLEEDMDFLLSKIRAKEEELRKMYTRRDSLGVEIGELTWEISVGNDEY